MVKRIRSREKLPRLPPPSFIVKARMKAMATTNPVVADVKHREGDGRHLAEIDSVVSPP